MHTDRCCWHTQDTDDEYSFYFSAPSRDLCGGAHCDTGSCLLALAHLCIRNFDGSSLYNAGMQWLQFRSEEHAHCAGSHYTDICLFVALNNVDIPAEPPSDGPFWAFADGDAAMAPYGRRFAPVKITDITGPGDFVIHTPGHFQAYRSRGADGTQYPCTEDMPPTYAVDRDSSAMVRELVGRGNARVLQVVCIDEVCGGGPTRTADGVDLCGGTTNTPTDMPTEAGISLPTCTLRNFVAVQFRADKQYSVCRT